MSQVSLLARASSTMMRNCPAGIDRNEFEISVARFGGFLRHMIALLDDDPEFVAGFADEADREEFWELTDFTDLPKVLGALTPRQHKQFNLVLGAQLRRLDA